MRRAATLAAMSALAIPATAIADTGAFYSVMPGGQGQDVNAVALAQYELTNTPPSTFTDQIPLYNGLIAGAQTLQNTSDLGRYFKPETYGIDPSQATSTESPRPGTTITRDRFNVPHVTGQTRSDALFGVGYAQAEDRLFFMDLLRHLGRGQLSAFVGPGSDNSFLKMDEEQLRVSDYTEPELQRLIDNGVAAAGPTDGPLLRQDLNDFTAGINAYISTALKDPTKLPAEYPGIGKLPQPWQPTDTAAVATLIAGLEGYGGGREADAAAVLQAANQRFGRRGRQVFNDFRQRLDPTTPTTTTKRFTFDNPGRVNPKSTALPDPGSITPLSATVASAGRTTRVAAPQTTRETHSHAVLITANRSTTGHPLAVMGPQLGFYSPEALLEMDVHGPGVNVRGVMLPGVFLVIMGRGSNFAWSATTATTDDTDEFVEKLCNPNGSRPTSASDHYLYRHRCIPLTKRILTIHTPGPNGLTPTALPETITFTLERSVHGPIQARATVRGQPVAIALARSSYLHDLDGAEAFKQLASGQVHDAASFQRAMATVNLGFNWFYADNRSAAFVQSGWYPHRAKGTDPSLPAWGTGRWDWRGFNPASFTESHIGYRGLPKDSDPSRGYVLNWNNDAARGWAAADNEWGYGPIYRSLLFERQLRAALQNRHKLSLTDLVKIMENAVTTDLRGRLLYPLLRKVIGKHPPKGLRPALTALDTWVAHGAFRRDLNGDNVYEDSGGIALMDSWWPLLMRAVFQPVLGANLIARITTIVPFDRSPQLDYTSYGVGWYGYLDRDLERVLRRHIRDPMSRRYCGRGSRRRCRQAIERSLQQAYNEVAARQGPDPAKWKVPATCQVQAPPQACDQLQFTTGGGVDTPPLPWQNRPTFQQVVEVSSPG